jgi:cbb3-type cytochrome oxidase subunit 1
VDRTVVLFLKGGLVWLVLGVTLGLCMALHPPLLAWRTAHIHMLLVGFVTGMIFGVGYHVFPRFAGRPLRHPRLVVPHWWLTNGGVGALATGFILRAEGVAWSSALLAAGGTAAALGAYLFACNIWRTIGGASLPRPVSPGRQVPLTVVQP